MHYFAPVVVTLLFLILVFGTVGALLVYTGLRKTSEVRDVERPPYRPFRPVVQEYLPVLMSPLWDSDSDEEEFVVESPPSSDDEDEYFTLATSPSKFTAKDVQSVVNTPSGTVLLFKDYHVLFDLNIIQNDTFIVQIVWFADTLYGTDGKMLYRIHSFDASLSRWKWNALQLDLPGGISNLSVPMTQDVLWVGGRNLSMIVDSNENVTYTDNRKNVRRCYGKDSQSYIEIEKERVVLYLDGMMTGIYPGEYSAVLTEDDRVVLSDKDDRLTIIDSQVKSMER